MRKDGKYMDETNMLINNETEINTENSEQTERRLFTYDEKTEILKSSNRKCACCGKPLTLKSMTVEHIIPIYRGGSNEYENLTALCYQCNQDKGNTLYLPRSFYSALIGTPRVQQMDDMVREWFKENKERYDMERYPLIAPRHNFMISPTQNIRKPIYNRQLIVTWTLISGEDYEEVEAISGVDLKNIRSFLERVRPDAMEHERHLYPHYETYKPVTFYALRKLSNQKLLALAALRYDKEEQDMAVYLIWVDMTKHSIPMILSSFIDCAFDAITNIAEEKIQHYIIFSNYSEAFDYYKNSMRCCHNWHKAEEAHYLDTITNQKLYTLIVYLASNQMPISIYNYLDVPKWLTPISTDE